MAEAWIVALAFAVCLFLLLITDLVVEIVVDVARLWRRVRS
jgi:hypothetical protein